MCSVPRAISGMRRLPSASMNSLTMRYSSVFCWPSALELEQQAFPQIPRADARRVEGLDHFQHPGNLIRRQPGGGRQLFHGGFQIAVLIDVADEHFRNRPLVLRQGGFANLLEQHFLQRRSRHQGIEHELPLLLVLGGGAHREIGLGKMIAPFLVELHQALKLRLKVIHRLAGALFGGGVKVHIRGRFARISRFGRLLRPRWPSFSCCSVSATDASSSTGFCCNSCSTSALSSSVGACKRASDCCSCGASTSDCVKRCDKCKP